MKKQLQLVAALLITATTLFGQTPTQQWLTVINSASGSNDVFQSGSSKFPTLLNSNGSKIAVTNNNGSQPMVNVLNTANGNINFTNTQPITANAKDIDFDSNDNLFSISHGTSSTNDGYLRKLDQSGNLLFSNTINKADGDNLLCVRRNSSEGAYVFSRLRNNSNSYNTHEVYSYTSTGVLQWTSTISDLDWWYGYDSRMTLDLNGNIIMGGKRQTTQSSANTYDIVIRKLNSNGTQLWQTYYDYNNLMDVLNSPFITDNNGDIYFADANSSNWSGTTIRLVKLNGQTGAISFQQQIGTSGVNGLLINTDGNIIVGGVNNEVRCYNSSNGTLVWSAPFTNINSISNDSNGKIYVSTTSGVSILNSTGTILNTINVGISGYTVNHVYTVVNNTGNEFYVVGYRTSGSINKVFVAKYSTSLPCNVSATSTQTNVLCNGGTNGSATVIASGGTAPYTYSWAPTGGSTATASGLAAGTYTCTITDANQCTTTKTVTITQPTTLTTASTQTNVLCNGGSTGSSSISVSGGTPAYTYSWTPSGGTAATAINLSAGNYTCTVRDANQCSTTKTVTITQPLAITSQINKQDATCFGTNDGYAEIYPANGQDPYSYLWQHDGSIDFFAANLTAGNYSCLITDANGCTHTETVTISQPNAILINISPSINTIHSGNNAVFTASSAIPSLSFQWQSNSNHTDWVNLSNNAFYNGVYSNNLTINNVNVNNHTQLFRAIANDGTCSGTSNQAQLLVSDTCITTINQTIYDTTFVSVTDTNYVTVYDTVTTYISVTDTLIINVITIGLNNNTIINTIKVFPNPAHSYITLDYGNYANLNGYSVKLVNALSQVIYNQPITQQSVILDLSTFGGNGIYYLNIINSQGNIVDVRKIVLQ